MTADEEQIIMDVLRQFNLDISDAKLVTDQLTQRLEETEQENIHAILEKQKEWQEIILQMRATKEQLSGIRTWIDHYNEKLMVLCSESSEKCVCSSEAVESELTRSLL